MEDAIIPFIKASKTGVNEFGETEVAGETSNMALSPPAPLTLNRLSALTVKEVNVRYLTPLNWFILKPFKIINKDIILNKMFIAINNNR